MPTKFLIDRFAEVPEAQALVWRDSSFSYGWLLEEVASWDRKLSLWEIPPGSVVLISSDFSPYSVALLLALVGRRYIVAPLVPAGAVRQDNLYEIARVEYVIELTNPESPTVERRHPPRPHQIIDSLKRRESSGLILFTSGSTGASKVVVHDCERFLRKYQDRRHSLRTIAFLQFDHIGGLDTLFYSLANTSCLITLIDRSPGEVCKVIEKQRVEVLPVSPAFINILLHDDSWRSYDLRSLKIVTYGAEVMPEGTLKRFHEAFPNVRAIQKYGTTEIGTLRSHSKSSDSVWVRIGGEGFATRIVDGMLEVKAESAMLGYLNADSPFTEDGWFKTGDAVDVDGDFFRILGRKSDLINIGGEKVFPAEVEAVLQSLSGVQEATVYSEQHALMGQIVVAKVHLSIDENLSSFRTRMRLYCKDKLAPFKIPQKLLIAEGPLRGDRLKKIRRAA